MGARAPRPVSDALKQRDAIISTRDRLAIDDAQAGAQGAQRVLRRVKCSSALLDGPPASRDPQRMDPTVRELVLLALLSAFLCGVALIYAQPIATAVFAALTSGCVVIAAGLSRGSWT